MFTDAVHYLGWLEQCLPFTVLKLNKFLYFDVVLELEQCLPFTVLKQMELTTKVPVEHGWNSAYRLRYWNRIFGIFKITDDQLEQCLPFTVLKRNINLISLIWHILPITIALTI